MAHTIHGWYPYHTMDGIHLWLLLTEYVGKYTIHTWLVWKLSISHEFLLPIAIRQKPGSLLVYQGSRVGEWSRGTAL